MFCDQCGAELAETAKFCGACGNKVSRVHETSTADTSVVVDLTKREAFEESSAERELGSIEAERLNPLLPAEPAEAAHTGNSVLNALRWAAFFPIGLLCGFLVAGIWASLGGWLLGQWAITAATVLFMAGSYVPMVATTCGLKIAPRPSRAVKWVMLSPMVILSLAYLYLIKLEFFAGEMPLGESLSEDFTGLSVKAQFVWIMLGTIVGTIFNVARRADVIVEDFR